MSTIYDDQLRARFAALAPDPGEGDWLDVRRRARRRRQKQLLGYALAATLALLLVGAATAAFGHRIVQWEHSEPAPAAIVDWLSAERELVAFTEPSFSKYHSGATRSVFEGMVATEHVEVLLTPLVGGGFIITERQRGARATGVGSTFLTKPMLTRQPLGVQEPEGRSISSRGEETGAASFVGWIARGLNRLELRYENGSTANVPYFRVTAPINAGFFVFDVPDGHTVHPHRARELVALDRRGATVARYRFSYQDREPEWTFAPFHSPDHFPPAADTTKVRVVRFPGVSGSLQLAPARDGALCFLSRHLRDGKVAGCLRDGDDWLVWRLGKWSFLNPTKGMFSTPRPPLNATGPLLWGIVEPDVTRVELRFQNGDREVIRPFDRFVLYQTTRRHFGVGARLARALLLDADGSVVRRIRFEPERHGVYPCRHPRIFRATDVAICP